MKCEHLSISVKGVNFYGPRSEFIVSGSDCGHVFLWDKETESIVQLLDGDEAGVVSTERLLFPENCELTFLSGKFQ